VKGSVIFIPFSDTLPSQSGQLNASTRFRCYQNAKALRKLGWVCEIGTRDKLHEILNFDIAVFQKRYFTRDYELAKKFKGKIVLDLSDPDWILFPKRKAMIDKMASIASIVTTSSSKLANHFSHAGYKAVCITEGFDFSTVPSNIVKRKDLTICWHGNSRNEQFLKFIAKPLNALRKEFAFTLKVIVNLESTSIPGLYFAPKVVTWKLETHLQEIAECHIGVAPLALDEWCSFKCPHKLFTYMALSLPVVCTAIQSYREVIENGVNGFIIESNDLDAWYEALKCLIVDEERRNSIIREGKKTALKFSSDRMAKEWDALFTRLISS